MSTNLTKKKRNKLIDKINYIKNFVESNSSEDESRKLLQYISEIEKDISVKKYGLVFEEHEEEIDNILKEFTPVLSERKDLFIGNDGDINFLLEGDNLASLELLKKTHLGKVDLIVTDPPYNTGSLDFIYNDKFIDADDLFRHSKWLSFMDKRLRIAYELLKDDGLMCIHIDDNEHANLKLLMDEIFGENNFVNSVAVKMSEPTGVKMAHVEKRLPKLKEYILIYKKKEINLKKVTIPKDEWDSEYKHVIYNASEKELEELKLILNKEEVDDEEIEIADEITSRIKIVSMNQLFKDLNITSKKSDDILKVKQENAWRIIRDVATSDGAKKIADEKRKWNNKDFFVIRTPRNKAYLIKNGYSLEAKQPRVRALFADNYLAVNAGDFWQDIRTTGLQNEGGVSFTNGKKPLKVERRLLELANNKEAIVLDFFAGSGTVGEAVLQQNKEDGGSRKYILCTDNALDPVIQEKVLIEKGYIEARPRRNTKNHEEWLKKYRELKVEDDYNYFTTTEEYQKLGICRSVTYKRMSYAIGKDNDSSLKYMNIEFIPTSERFYYEYINELLDHIRELVELENAVDFERNNEVAIVLTDEELIEFINTLKNEKNYKIIYLGHDVLMNQEQEKKMLENNMKVNVIPDYYYKDLRG